MHKRDQICLMSPANLFSGSNMWALMCYRMVQENK